MKKLLLFSGLLAPVLYLAAVVLGGVLRAGYSHLAEPISELVAAGAPDRPLLSALFIAYNALSVAFAVGLLLNDTGGPGTWAYRTAGSIALAAVGVLGLMLEFFFPQDPGGIPVTFAGTMHIALAGIVSLATLGAILFTGLALRHDTGFEYYLTYSRISAVILFISGGLTALAVANHHPLLGLSERITIGSYVQWLFVTAALVSRSVAAPDHVRAPLVRQPPASRQAARSARQ